MIKYIPIIQMVGMLLLNMLYDIFNINFYKIYDFIFEDSIVTTIMLYISSITFEFYNWHKIVIVNNYVLNELYTYQKFYDEINIIYNIDIVVTIFIIIELIKYINNKDYGHKIKNNKNNSTRID
jgi:hypothetical protein